MTRKPQPFAAALLPLLALLLSACGNDYHRVPVQAAPISYDNAAYASALCTDDQGIRVLDNYCPIDDGVIGPGGYGWRYHSYLASDPYQDVVYIGYPVGATYVVTRPARVSTLHIDRGRFPASAPPGVRSSSVRVSSLPTVQRSPASSVSRGGFGVPATGTPLPTPAGQSFAAPRALPKAPPPARGAAAAPAPKYAPRTSGGSSSSSGGWGGSKSATSGGSKPTSGSSSGKAGK
jgi:hypothetical protein